MLEKYDLNHLQASQVEAELLGLREVVMRQKDLLEQQKQLQESTIKQMRELDQYLLPFMKAVSTELAEHPRPS